MSWHRMAISPDGYTIAVAQPGDSWWVFVIPPKGQGYVSDLPDGWTEYAPATARDRLADAAEQIAEELESAAGSLVWLQSQVKAEVS